MSPLATVLIAMKDLADAEKATRDALKFHGPDHPDTARAVRVFDGLCRAEARARALLHTHAGAIPATEEA